jgi:hypothetical protein
MFNTSSGEAIHIPVNIALGIISPNTNSTVTLNTIVKYVGINWSKNNGRHS